MECPIVSAAVQPELKLELDRLARERRLTRSATIAQLLELAVARLAAEGAEFVEVPA